MSSEDSGLAYWGISTEIAERKPLLATSSAIEAVIGRAAENPYQALPQPLRQELAVLAQELLTLADPAQNHSPAVQMSLIINHIDMRTGFNARYALGRMPRELPRPLFTGQLASLPPVQQQMVREVETGLNNLAADFVKLRAKQPATAPQ
jgi:hypothetical protein